jgi:hypothetical protein
MSGYRIAASSETAGIITTAMIAIATIAIAMIEIVIGGTERVDRAPHRGTDDELKRSHKGLSDESIDGAHRDDDTQSGGHARRARVATGGAHRRRIAVCPSTSLGCAPPLSDARKSAWSSQDSADTSLRLTVNRFKLLRTYTIEVAVPT